MEDNNNPKEKIIEKSTNKSFINPIHRLLFFIAFIILTFLFNIEAIALVNEDFKYKTFYLKMLSFFILCLFPITEYDKMKSIMVFLVSIVLLFFHVTFIPLSPIFLSFMSIFTKIYSLAYLRIWVDQFAMLKYKTLFIYIINIFALSGDKISIVINRFINFKKIASNIVFVQFIIFIVFFFIPDKFFFIHNNISHYRENIIQNNEEKREENLDEDKKYPEKISISVFSNYEKGGKVQKKVKKSKFRFYQICINPCYIYSNLGKSSLFFLIALSDYALNDYCSKIINPEQKAILFNNYENIISILSITGSIFGGILSIFIGGYEEIFSCLVISISDLILLISCFYLSYTKYFLVILISFCISFFSINVIMGDIEGFIIKSIPLKYKELGLNFSGFLSTIACFLARNIYDYVKLTFDKDQEISTWRFCTYCFFFGFFSILLACTYRYRDILKTKKIKEKRENKENEMEEYEWEQDLNNLDDGYYAKFLEDISIATPEKSNKKFSSSNTIDSITS